MFIQFGRLYVDRPRELYPSFPGLTLGEFARYNRVDLEPFLVELNAAAESEEAAWLWSPFKEPALGEFSLTLGYTGGYWPVEAVPDNVPVVIVQSARGPE